jgi:hypothetical protein
VLRTHQENKEGRMRKIGSRLTAVLLIVSLSGCSLVMPSHNSPVVTKEKKQVVAENIDSQWEYIGDKIEDPSRTVSEEKLEGSLVVDQMLQEDQGEAYLDFCYSVASGEDSELVLEKAELLVSEKQYEELLESVEAARGLIMEQAEARMLSIDEENREEFYKDLRRLVVSTTVLLTASVVYSAMPHIYFWGKISALAAVSVSAGAAAGTVIAVYDWYVNDIDIVDAFSDWIKMITDEPYAAYLMATSVISLGQSMNMNPVSCSVILGVFTVFNALNIVRDMLEAYGEEV